MASDPDSPLQVDPSALPESPADGQSDAAAQPGSGPPRVRVRPEQTRDDTDAGWGERPDEDGHDRWLREQRPPHWG